jgi:competence protein ComEC
VASDYSSGAFLYTLAMGLVAGIALGLIFTAGVTFLVLGIAGAAVSVALGALMHNKRYFLVAIALLALVLGLVRADLFLFKESQENISTFVGSASVVGTVANDPAISGAHLQADVFVTSVNGKFAKGTLLAFLPPETTLSYGQTVILRGTFAAPTTFVGDNGNIFDYPTYLRVQGVSMLLTEAQLKSAKPASPSIFGVLFFSKHAFDASLERLLPEPDVSLLEGILLGQRHGLPKELTEAFVVAGLIHIVILSGYSMSVVSEGILRSLGFLPKRVQMICAALCMVLFVLMTGAAATTVRACAMALVALVARYFHRSALALRSLAAVAVGMVLWNPPLILGDASFFVSVLATFGLIVFAPAIETMLRRVPERFEMRAIVTSTIAVQIFALPALLYFTGNLSFLSVPANLLVLPLLPLVMLAGLASGLLGFVSTALAFVPAVFTDLLLQWILLVAHTTQALPFASATLVAFPLWLAIVIYIPLTALAIYVLQQNAPRTRSN